jgi:hypothetical protein
MCIATNLSVNVTQWVISCGPVNPPSPSSARTTPKATVRCWVIPDALAATLPPLAVRSRGEG